MISVSKRKITLSVGCALLISLFASGCDASESGVQDDIGYGLSLLEANGIEASAEQIERVLRDDLETVVWVESRFEGLPVFYHNVGYVFEADGQQSLEPGGDRPLRLGSPLADRGSFPLDHRPDIDEQQAFDAYRERSGQEAEERLVAVLGFHNLNLGTARSPQYRLAWRVTPADGPPPEAMVSAKKGDVLYFDSGIRTAEPSGPGLEDIVLIPEWEQEENPNDEPSASEAFAGRWYGPACDLRPYVRVLELGQDGTFTATDLISPCPKDVRCVRSGIVTRMGTWRVDRRMIELTPNSESSPPTGVPLPRLLDTEWTEGRLVELVVGGPMTCEYSRQRSQPAPPPPDVPASACHAAVQGKIAWDYNGSMNWAGQNLDRLCAGAKETTEPAICFAEAMHGGMPGKASTEWRWQDALALCAGTVDAQQTLGCYQVEVRSGTPWAAAVEACGAE